MRKKSYTKIIKKWSKTKGRLWGIGCLFLIVFIFLLKHQFPLFACDGYGGDRLFQGLAG